MTPSLTSRRARAVPGQQEPDDAASHPGRRRAPPRSGETRPAGRGNRTAPRHTADQPLPALSPGGWPPGESHGTSRVAIASFARGTGALVLSAVYLGALLGPLGAMRPLLAVTVLMQLVGSARCPAAIVLGIVALAQIRRTGQRGKGRAVTG